MYVKTKKINQEVKILAVVRQATSDVPKPSIKHNYAPYSNSNTLPPLWSLNITCA